MNLKFPIAILITTIMVILFSPKAKALDWDTQPLSEEEFLTLANAYGGIEWSDFYVYGYTQAVGRPGYTEYRYQMYFFNQDTIEFPNATTQVRYEYASLGLAYYYYGPGNSSNSFTRQSFGPWQSSLLSYQNYFSGLDKSHNLTIKVGDDTVLEPETKWIDSYYIRADGWNIDYWVLATKDSNYQGWYTKSRQYTLRFTALGWDDEPITYTVPQYPAWYGAAKPTWVNIADTPSLFDYKSYYYKSIQPYIQSVYGIKPGITLGVTMNPALDVDAFNYRPDDNEPVLSVPYQSIMDEFDKLYEQQAGRLPDNQNIWYQDIKAEFVGLDGTVYYSTTIPYSALDPDIVPPPKDNSQIDWTNPDDVENKTKDDPLLDLPPDYTPPPSFDFDYSIGDIPDVEFSFVAPEFDDGAMGFWHWLIDFLYTYPQISIFLTASLMFFVLKVVLHG